MKSNKMMNIAYVLMVLVLLTTCGLSKTYAKYTTQSSINDKARVGKWGVEVIVDSDGTFSTAYNANGNGISLKDYEEAEDFLANAKVLSLKYTGEQSTKVLAPGTKGTLCSVQIRGKPEVAVQVTAIADIKSNAGNDDRKDGWNVGKEVYFPIIFTVENKDYGIGIDGIKEVDDLFVAVETAIANAISKSYQPNQNLSQEMEKVNVRWRWNFKHDFVQDPWKEEGYAYYTNKKDTILTNPDRVVSTLSFDLTIKVTQID